MHFIMKARMTNNDPISRIININIIIWRDSISGSHRFTLLPDATMWPAAWPDITDRPSNAIFLPSYCEFALVLPRLPSPKGPFFSKSQNIHPSLHIRRKLVQILSTQQPNRSLIHKLPRIRFVIPEEVVIQPRLTVGVLVLQAEGLVCAIRYLGFFFQTTPGGVFAVPQEITVDVGPLARNADLAQWK